MTRLTIYKYPVPGAHNFSLELPRGAKLLSAQESFGAMVLWALVDPNAPTEARKFALRETGEDATGMDTARYIGTVQSLNGEFVEHLFEMTPTTSYQHALQQAEELFDIAEAKLLDHRQSQWDALNLMQAIVRHILRALQSRK